MAVAESLEELGKRVGAALQPFADIVTAPLRAFEAIAGSLLP